jgi:membrane-bound lytic murein transglycosylase B
MRIGSLMAVFAAILLSYGAAFGAEHQKSKIIKQTKIGQAKVDVVGRLGRDVILLNVGYTPEELRALLMEIEVVPPSGGKRLSSEIIRERYRAVYLNAAGYARGRAYMESERKELSAAEKQFGVPKEVITAILWVETNFGDILGDKVAMEVLFGRAVRAKALKLAHVAIENFDQLRDFFVLCKKLGLSPRAVKSSYAGALGIPQFMPLSYKGFALDGDDDNIVDLFNSHADAIVSAANYLERHGARRNIRESVKAYNHSDIYADTVLVYAGAISTPIRFWRMPKRSLIPKK